MADLIQKQEQQDGKTAEKVGDYSVSYADSDTNQTARQKRRYEPVPVRTDVPGVE